MSGSSLTLAVNGQQRDVAPGTTVDQLVGSVARSATGVAVAVNDAVIPRAGWSTTPLHDGDRVEVLAAVPGG